MLTIEQIKARLEDRNLTAVAKKTGISRATLSGIVNGKTKPSYAVLVVLTDYLERN